MHYRYTIFIILVFAGVGKMSYSQEPERPAYKPQVYINDNGDIYVQKSLPLYLKFSTEPNGTNYNLKATNPRYGEPMYLDTEGPNYIRSKWAVDPETRRTAVPEQEVLYEVNADGQPPYTTLKFTGAPRYNAGGKTYFGKNLSFELSSRDAVSGVKEINYALGGSYTQYKSAVSVGQEGDHTLYYYAADYVGNAEQTRTSNFTVDITPPTTKYEIVGIHKNGEILSPTARLRLSSSDNISGVKYTYYTVDGGSPRAYYNTVDLSSLSDGEHSIKYYATDNVQNTEGGEGGAAASVFTFYLDKTPPVPTHQIKGDQYKGNYLYISPRTTVALVATDNKAGVKNIYYRIDGGERSTYSAEFKIPSVRGVHTVKYDANDQVDNLSGNRYITVFMDNDNPETGIIYGNPQFMDRDTLFITSQTPITLKARDDASGVQSTTYQVDGQGYKPYAQFTIAGEGFHKIQFKSTDRVNNQEAEKTSTCYIDNSAPEIFIKFSIEPIGKRNGLNIYPNYTRMYVAATDKKVGTETIQYSMDDGPLTLYSSPQTLDASELSRFRKNKKYKVKVVAKDKLGNTSEETIEFYVGKDEQ
ncbi:MAG: hypothetical protein Kow0075_02080 [Salibacteraceae bacterium]